MTATRRTQPAWVLVGGEAVPFAREPDERLLHGIGCNLAITGDDGEDLRQPVVVLVEHVLGPRVPALGPRQARHRRPFDAHAAPFRLLATGFDLGPPAPTLPALSIPGKRRV
ncbi:MAG: hypothetical protein M1337_01845 [Actinobacteria bacterium]|nr:hypothetical protein [Actinomycetota bacterium]